MKRSRCRYDLKVKLTSILFITSNLSLSNYTVKHKYVCLVVMEYYYDWKTPGLIHTNLWFFQLKHNDIRFRAQKTIRWVKPDMSALYWHPRPPWVRIKSQTLIKMFAKWLDWCFNSSRIKYSWILKVTLKAQSKLNYPNKSKLNVNKELKKTFYRYRAQKMCKNMNQNMVFCSFW